jgi:hypothetical protein
MHKSKTLAQMDIKNHRIASFEKLIKTRVAESITTHEDNKHI